MAAPGSGAHHPTSSSGNRLQIVKTSGETSRSRSRSSGVPRDGLWCGRRGLARTPSSTTLTSVVFTPPSASPDRISPVREDVVEVDWRQRLHGMRCSLVRLRESDNGDPTNSCTGPPACGLLIPIDKTIA
ncbi:hypothetical protein EJB05_29492 [Eragrostis curvula]|uniref:Uncharacterized protein n=1 Tax=Eragrostis curvula TaxID=38414 RepID=A0A5J9USV0_9POAL|nr:hypothetical protein EJB05_29492 [Eragrostis curvula]